MTKDNPKLIKVRRNYLTVDTAYNDGIIDGIRQGEQRTLNDLEEWMHHCEPIPYDQALRKFIKKRRVKTIPKTEREKVLKAGRDEQYVITINLFNDLRNKRFQFNDEGKINRKEMNK